MSPTTLPSSLLPRLSSPYAICVGAGFAASSYFFWGNVGCSAVGIFPAVASKRNREKLGLDVGKGVEMFSWFYEGGKTQFFFIASSISFTSLLTAAFLGPRTHRNYHLLNTALTFFVAPWTGLAMLPTITKLLTLRDRIVLARSSGAPSPVSTPKEQAEAEELMAYWQVLHLIRTAVGGLGWVMATGGLMML